MQDKIRTLESVVKELLSGNKDNACNLIQKEYPFERFEVFHRTYTLKQKMKQFKADGFIDRYSGDKLINPGILKVLSFYFPEEFPYHPHGKMTEGHIAYWELIPTLDHIYPIAKGGQDDEKNWVTTSMKNNSIKSNYTIDEIHWKLYPQGDIADWDGLTSIFLKLVDNDKELLEDGYIKKWYNVSKSCLYNKTSN